MAQQAGVTAVAQVIELAVAPVFLLTAIGTMLAVLTNRLARIVGALVNPRGADPASRVSPTRPPRSGPTWRHSCSARA